LFKRNKDINYEKCLSDENEDKTKKYYIIPLKIKKDENAEMFDFEQTQNKKLTKICYEVDYKLLQKVEKLKLNGYKNEQKNIMSWLADLKITNNL